MVTPDDEVRCAEVLTDDRMPNGLARAGHAHGKGEEGKVTHAVRVLRHDGLVHTDAGVVVDVAWFSQTNNWVDEDVRLTLACSTDRQLTVCTMHRVAGLESDNTTPSEFLEMCTELSRGICHAEKVSRYVMIVRK